jgi:hypothetical protein
VDERYLAAAELVASSDRRLCPPRLTCLAESLLHQSRYTQSCVEHVSFGDRGGQTWTRDLQLRLPIATTPGVSKRIIAIGQFGRRRLPDLSVTDSTGRRLSLLTRAEQGEALATLILCRGVDAMPRRHQHLLRKPGPRTSLGRARAQLGDFLTHAGDIQDPLTSVLAVARSYFLLLVRLRVDGVTTERLVAHLVDSCVELLDGAPYLCWADAAPGDTMNIHVFYTTRDPKINPDYSGLARPAPVTHGDSYAALRADLDRDLGLGPIKHEFDIPSYRHVGSYAFTISPPEKTSPMFLDWGAGNSLRADVMTSCSLDSGCLPEGAANADTESPWGGRTRAFIRVSPHQRVQILAAAALNIIIVLALRDGRFPAHLSGPLQGLVLAAPSGLVAYLVSQQRHYYAYPMRRQRAILWGYLTITVAFLVALAFTLEASKADDLRFGLLATAFAWLLFVSSVAVLAWYLPLGFGFNWIVASFTRRKWRQEPRHGADWETYVATYQAYGRMISYGVVVAGLMAIGILHYIWHDPDPKPLHRGAAKTLMIQAARGWRGSRRGSRQARLGGRAGVAQSSQVEADQELPCTLTYRS